MEVPEIRFSIGLFLDTRSLAAIATVSRKWHETATSILYRHFSLNFKPSQQRENEARYLNAMTRHSDHVRSLSLTIGASNNLDCVNCFTNLKSLHLIFKVYSKDIWLWTLAFLQRSSQICSLDLSFYSAPISGIQDTHEFLSSLPDSIPLRRLYLNDGTFYSKEIQLLAYKYCNSLELLHLQQLNLIKRPEAITNKQVTAWIPQNVLNIEKLNLNKVNPTDEGLIFLEHSPNLKSLRLSFNTPISQMEIGKLETFFGLQEPGLESLEFGNYSIADENLVRVIQNCKGKGRLTSIIDYYGNIGSLSMKLLLPLHSMTLTHIYIQNENSPVASPIIQKILTSCYQLKLIWADMLNVCDILADEIDIDHTISSDHYIEDGEIEDIYDGMPDEGMLGNSLGDVEDQNEGMSNNSEGEMFNENDYIKKYLESYGDNYYYTRGDEEKGNGDDEDNEEGSSDDEEYMDVCMSDEETEEEMEGLEFEKEYLVGSNNEWVCTNLEHFGVFICGLRKKPIDWHKRTFKKLSKLKRLRSLTIGPSRDLAGRILIKNFYRMTTWDGLDMSIEAGLRHLRTLKELETLDFFYLSQEIGSNEINWMIANWPKLREVFGELSDDLGEFEDLSYILAHHNVSSTFEDFMESENFKSYRYHA